MGGRNWESLARAMLRTVLGDLEEVDRDRPGLTGACDWRVQRPDGRIAAIEITSHTLPEARQLANEQLRQGPTVADASGLERRWNLHLRPDPRPRYRDTLRAVRERGGEVLGCLERRGTFSFAIDDDQDERLASPEIRALWTWGFEFGLAQSPGHGTPGITILPPGGSGILSPNRAIQAAQRQVEPNRAKLLAADADEHHLFVWVDGFDAITMWAMEPERGHGPSWVPELGPGVDTLWVATRTWKQGVVVWWVTPPALWQVDLLSDALWQQHRPSR